MRGDRGQFCAGRKASISSNDDVVKNNDDEGFMLRQEEERREKEIDPKHNRRIELLRKSRIHIMMTIKMPF